MHDGPFTTSDIRQALEHLEAAGDGAAPAEQWLSGRDAALLRAEADAELEKAGLSSVMAENLCAGDFASGASQIAEIRSALGQNDLALGLLRDDMAERLDEIERELTVMSADIVITAHHHGRYQVLDGLYWSAISKSTPDNK